MRSISNKSKDVRPADFKPRKVHDGRYGHDVFRRVCRSERVYKCERCELGVERANNAAAVVQLRSGLAGAGGGCSMNMEISARGSTALLMLLCRAVSSCEFVAKSKKSRKRRLFGLHFSCVSVRIARTPRVATCHTHGTLTAPCTDRATGHGNGEEGIGVLAQ